jgi:general secretion pathway protein G
MDKPHATADAPKAAHTTVVTSVTGEIFRFCRMGALSCSTLWFFEEMLPMKRFASQRLRRSRGFTLIELMVVLVIIGVLAALIVPNVLNRADDARVTAARTDISNLMQALKLYRLDNQNFPSTEQGLSALVTKPSVGNAPLNWKPYVDKLPNDPWGHPYQYLNPGIKGEVDVLSFGADGQSGGEGKNADIGSWQ